MEIYEPKVEGYDKEYFYDGELGAIYYEGSTVFRLWAPKADKVYLLLHTKSEGTKQKLEMGYIGHGVYEYIVYEDCHGLFYTYEIYRGETFTFAVDPYAKSVGANGKMGVVIDEKRTMPDGFEKDIKPVLHNATDAIIYELHVKDATIGSDAGVVHKGKYLGLTELETTNGHGYVTGLSHMKELGVTHVQLLPIFDYLSVDETGSEEQYNWGYDPMNYNAPEGSYATNPYDGITRVIELKKMIQTFHSNGLRVIMDVVFNHTGSTLESNFQKIVPDYYYRKADEEFTDASACGNETASDHLMMRKFIVDSIVYWVKAYHIDGFRFDLMGIHDIETMKRVRKEVDKIDPTILIYGEGWSADESPLNERYRAIKENAHVYAPIGCFSDDLRDAIKGHVFEEKEKGFVNGGKGQEESVKFGIVGGVKHPQIEYALNKYAKTPWALLPEQSINYAEAHDNLTLWDKLKKTNPRDSKEDRIYMQKLAAAIFMTSQGIPFVHAGMEFLRTKKGDENSYKSPISINQLDWSRKGKYIEVVQYFRGLIQLRKKYEGFRMTTAKAISESIYFYEKKSPYKGMNLEYKQMIGYIINHTEVKGVDGAICVFFNGSKKERKVSLPKGEWQVIANRDAIMEKTERESTVKDEIVVKGIEALLLVKENPVVFEIHK